MECDNFKQVSILSTDTQKKKQNSNLPLFSNKLALAAWQRQCTLILLKMQALLNDLNLAQQGW